VSSVEHSAGNQKPPSVGSSVGAASARYPACWGRSLESQPLRCSRPQFSRRDGWPKRQELGFFIAAVLAFERVNSRVAVGGVKIDHSASYCAAAFQAGVIDIEVQRHVSSLSLQANGGHSKGSAEIAMLRRRSDTLRWRLRRTANHIFALRTCRDRWSSYPQIILGRIDALDGFSRR
jgi:hypothetical protein